MKCTVYLYIIQYMPIITLQTFHVILSLQTLASLEPTPAPVTPPRLAPPLLHHGDSLDAPPSASGVNLDKTPERVEFDIESEVEESEVEQTAHNLSASLLSLDEEDGDSDSDE